MPTELVHYTTILSLLTSLQTTVDTKLHVLDTRLSELESRLVPPPTDASEPLPTLTGNPPLLTLKTQHEKLDDLKETTDLLLDHARVTDRVTARTDAWVQRISAHLDRQDEAHRQLVQQVALGFEGVQAQIEMRDPRFDSIDASLLLAIETTNTVGAQNLAAIQAAQTEERGRFDRVDGEIAAVAAAARDNYNNLSGVANATAAAVRAVDGKLDTAITRVNAIETVVNNAEKALVAKSDEIIKLENAAKLRDECIYMNTITREINHVRTHDRDDFYPLVDIHTGQQIDCVTREEIQNVNPVHKKRFLRQLGMQEPFPNVARYYWAYLKGGVAPAEGTQ